MPDVTSILDMAGVKAVSIAIGPNNTGILTEQGTAYIWGANGSGQLPVGDDVPRLTVRADVLLDRAHRNQSLTCCLRWSARLGFWPIKGPDRLAGARWAAWRCCRQERHRVHLGQ
mgnify:CR=1 FL=1